VHADREAHLFTERHRALELAVVVPEEDELLHADRLARRPLLFLACLRERLGWHLRIVRALVSAGEKAVRHVSPALDEARQRPRAAEVNVVGMRDDRHGALRYRERLRHDLDLHRR
jgi:hypothetical protein